MKTNRLSPTLTNLLNEQITLEAYSAQVYLMLSSWADEAYLDGVSAYLFQHHQEEREHMAKIIEYIQERGGKVTIEAIPAPGKEPKNLLTCFEMVLDQEVINTQSIYNIVNAAMKESDWATWNFLQWLVNEQREEEKLALTLLDKVKLAGGAQISKEGLYEVNKTLSRIPQSFELADDSDSLV